MAKLAILYGSQTGVGKDIAEKMTRQAIQLELPVLLCSMNDYSIKTKAAVEEEHVIFIASTTGQGDEPDNMKDFWKFLCRRSCPSIFKGIKYSVLALGDSSYAKYNFVGKKLHKRIAQLGGISIAEIGLADDQHDLGVDATAPGWTESVWKGILQDKFTEVPSGIIDPKYEIRTSSENGHSPNAECHPEVHFNKIRSNTRATAADHFQDVRYIEIEAENLPYEPGDVVCIVPQNTEDNVSTFFEIFDQLDACEEISIQPRFSWIEIPSYLQVVTTPRTWRGYAKYYLDIQAVPSKSFFEYLNHFAEDELEKWKLSEFCTPQGQDDLYKYCFKPKRNILEVLQDFPKTAKKIATEYIFDLIPGLKYRAFSIASYKPRVIGILVAVVNYQTTIKKPRTGLCSNWLAGLAAGAEIPCWVDKGTFTFPKPDEVTDVIMIGPGTGCAPFNSYINYEFINNAKRDLHFFFGCRSASKDYYFKEDLADFCHRHQTLKLYVAHSRDAGYPYKYVQDQIKANSDILYDLVCRKNAVIYVAGNAKTMPTEVQQAIIEVLQAKGLGDDADFYVKNLARTGRYQTEVWR